MEGRCRAAAGRNDLVAGPTVASIVVERLDCPVVDDLLACGPSIVIGPWGSGAIDTVRIPSVPVRASVATCARTGARGVTATPSSNRPIATLTVASMIRSTPARSAHSESGVVATTSTVSLIARRRCSECLDLGVADVGSPRSSAAPAARL